MSSVEQPHLSPRTHDALEFAERHARRPYQAMSRWLNDSVSPAFQHLEYRKQSNAKPGEVVLAQVEGDPSAPFLQKKWKAAVFGIDAEYIDWQEDLFQDTQRVVGFESGGVIRAASLPAETDFKLLASRGLYTWGQRQGRGELKPFGGIQLPNGRILTPRIIHVLDKFVPAVDFANNHPGTPLY